MFGLDIIITFNLGYYNSEGWPINSRCDPPPFILTLVLPFPATGFLIRVLARRAFMSLA